MIDNDQSQFIQMEKLSTRGKTEPNYRQHVDESANVGPRSVQDSAFRLNALDREAHQKEADYINDENRKQEKRDAWRHLPVIRQIIGRIGQRENPPLKEVTASQIAEVQKARSQEVTDQTIASAKLLKEINDTKDLDRLWNMAETDWAVSLPLKTRDNVPQYELAPISHQQEEIMKRKAKERLTQIMTAVSRPLAQLINGAQDNADLFRILDRYGGISNGSNPEFWRMDGDIVLNHSEYQVHSALNGLLARAALEQNYKFDPGNYVFGDTSTRLQTQVEAKIKAFNQKDRLVRGVIGKKADELVEIIGHGISRGMKIGRDKRVREFNIDHVRPAIAEYIRERLGKDDEDVAKRIMQEIQYQLRMP